MIDLMIVIAILGMLAGILIPQLLRGRLSAAEKTAVQTMKVFSTMQTLYSGDNNRFAKISELQAGNYLDIGADLLGQSAWDGDVVDFRKTGYDYKFVKVNDYEWRLTAKPQGWGKTGQTSFYVDESNTVRSSADANAPAGKASPPLK